jgi:hypothetical protein
VTAYSKDLSDVYIRSRQSYKTKSQNKVTGFGFSLKPSSDLLDLKNDEVNHSRKTDKNEDQLFQEDTFLKQSIKKTCILRNLPYKSLCNLIEPRAPLKTAGYPQIVPASAPSSNLKY